MTKVCDHASVGVLLRDPAGAVLLIKRGTYPPGWAGVAGHVYDDHPGYYEAAIAEAREEAGVQLTPGQIPERATCGGWRDNRCRRQPCQNPEQPCPGIGHDWAVWMIDVPERPALHLSERETAGAMWATPHELGYLAGRTVAYASGHVPAAEWANTPGLEPVWVRWLCEAGLIDLPGNVLDRIESRLNG